MKDSKNKDRCPTNALNLNLQAHWDNTYLNRAQKKLGWYETDLSPTLRLLDQANLSKGAHILNVGAGSTTLIDELAAQGYTNLTATDISRVALDQLHERLDNEQVKYIVDDLTQPNLLENIGSVDFWLDRAVLHFFTDKVDQDTYFGLLKRKVKAGGFVLLAQFHLEGSAICSKLPVRRYSEAMYRKHLGDDFELIDTFKYVYMKPDGQDRPYVYALYRKK